VQKSRLTVLERHWYLPRCCLASTAFSGVFSHQEMVPEVVVVGCGFEAILDTDEQTRQRAGRCWYVETQSVKREGALQLLPGSPRAELSIGAAPSCRGDSLHRRATRPKMPVSRLEYMHTCE